MGIRLKFNAVLVLVMLTWVFFINHSHQRQVNFQYQQHLSQTAEQLFLLTENLRTYTESEVATVISASSQEFLPQSVGSYAATQAFTIGAKPLGFEHQVAMLDTQVPRYEANVWQRELINFFQDNPSQPSLTRQLVDAAGGFYVLAKPIKSQQQISGIKLIRINTDQDTALLEQNQTQFTVQLIVTALILWLVINLALHFVLFKPLTTLANHSDKISRGESDSVELESANTIELNLISAAFNRMQRSLKAAMNLLS